MRRAQAGRDAGHQPAHRLGLHRSLGDEVGQRDAVDILHRQIGAADRRVDGEDVVADDGIVGEVGEDGRFLAEQRQHGLVAGELRQHDLDRHRIVGLDVVAAIDLAHAAEGDVLVDLEDAVELGAGPDGFGGRNDACLVVGGHYQFGLSAVILPESPGMKVPDDLRQ